MFDGVESDRAGRCPVAALLHTIILTTDDVGVCGLERRIDRDEIGISAVGILGCDAPAAVAFIEVEMSALVVTVIPEIIVAKCSTSQVRSAARISMSRMVRVRVWFRYCAPVPAGCIVAHSADRGHYEPPMLVMCCAR